MGTIHRALLACAFMSAATAAPAELLPPTKAVDATAVERFDYRLAYQGLLTAFLWKDLADVSIFSLPDTVRFGGSDGCKMVMTLSTERYSFAEVFHPVRYRWESTTSPDLSRTYLTEERDTGSNREHNVVLMDWPNKRFSVYRKREKKLVDAYWEDSSVPVQVWETTENPALPPFLRDYPLLDGKYSYFIPYKSKKTLNTDTGVDPLAMIYRIRRHDFTTKPDHYIEVTHDNKVNRYHARLVQREVLQINDAERRSLRIVVIPEGEAKHGKGQMDLWLSDDARRLPLRFEVKAPVGLLRIGLVNYRTREDSPLGGCINPRPGLSANVRSAAK